MYPGKSSAIWTLAAENTLPEIERYPLISVASPAGVTSGEKGAVRAPVYQYRAGYGLDRHISDMTTTRQLGFFERRVPRSTPQFGRNVFTRNSDSLWP